VARTGDSRDAYRVLMRKPDHLDDTGADGKITLKCILKEISWEGGRGGSVYWIDLARVMKKWRALVNRVTKLRVP
jgi:hypothetical protein